MKRAKMFLAGLLGSLIFLLPLTACDSQAEDPMHSDVATEGSDSEGNTDEEGLPQPQCPSDDLPTSGLIIQVDCQEGCPIDDGELHAVLVLDTSDAFYDTTPITACVDGEHPIFVIDFDKDAIGITMSDDGTSFATVKIELYTTFVWLEVTEGEGAPIGQQPLGSFQLPADELTTWQASALDAPPR